VTDQLRGGAANVVPLQVSAVRDAYATGATKLVHGYFEKRRQALHFEFLVEDAQTHKTLQTVAGDGAPLPALDRLAKDIDAGAHEFSTANAEAVAAWGHGDFETAVKLDPNFGPAWMAWVDARSAAGDARQAFEIVQRALGQPGLKSPVDRARLELASATLRHDDPARQRAVVALAGLMPNDAALLRQLASQEMNARRFAQAAQFYQDVLRIEPEDIESWNLLGYAQGFAGDLEAARKSFEQYGSNPAHAANALDSAGEVYFSRGKFAEAEKYFLQAHAKSSALLAGDDLLKAAYSRWRQGDLPGADQHFAQYVAFRSEQKDPVLDWRHAVWQYATGRTAEAMARLANVSGPGPASEIARAQLSVWKDLSKLPSDPAQLKQVYERTPPALDGITRVLYASALLQAGQKEEARKLLELWPLPGLDGDPLLQSLLFPKYLELKRELN
jgi:tetratricopeptide (TPR) repeat protein